MNRKIALISTLPKSGTWYSQIFFWYYTQLLLNQEQYFRGDFKPDLVNALRERKIKHEIVSAESLKLDKLYICHSVCPGFYELNNAHYWKYSALHFPVHGYNWGEDFIRLRNDWGFFNPTLNPDARIVYIYRNPLDHFVSYFHHTKNHIHANQRVKTFIDGQSISINNLHDFIFTFGGLSGFIKHYYPYKIMRLLFPQQIMLISYEELTRNPNETFNKILSFIGAEPLGSLQKQLVDDALLMCQIESLIQIETQLNRSLANDQLGEGRHIRGGEIGKWQTQLNAQELEAIEIALNTFDISLNDFCLVKDESPTIILPWLMDMKSKQYSHEFFQHQLNELGQQLISTREQLKQAKKHIQFTESSKSWRLTAPFRTLWNVFAK